MSAGPLSGCPPEPGALKNTEEKTEEEVEDARLKSVAEDARPRAAAGGSSSAGESWFGRTSSDLQFFIV